MIYLLIGIQLFLTIASFLIGKKKFIYPPFVLNATFLASSILSLYYKYKINYDISLKTILVVVICNLTFTLTYILFRKKEKEEITIASKLSVSNIKLAILYLVQIVAVFVFFNFFKNTMNITNLKELPQYINEFREGNSFYGTILLPMYVKVLNNISYAITIVFTYTLARNLCAYVSKKEFVVKNVKLIGAYILYMPIIILMGERFNILILFLIAFCSYFITYYKINVDNNAISKKTIITLICCVVFLVVLFSASRFIVGRGQEKSLIHYIAEYFGNSIINLDYFLKNPTFTDLKGEETFFGLYKNLHEIGILKNFNAVYQLPFAVEGNTYTAYRKYYADFSYFGILIVILFSIITRVFENLMIKSKKNVKDYAEILYSCFFTSVCLVFYSDIFFGSYLTLGYFSIVIYILLILFFIKKETFLDKKEHLIHKNRNIKKIEKADVISFDLYDTLINRITLKSKDIYKTVKNVCDDKGIEIDSLYVQKRMKADASKGVELKSLMEIYKFVNIEGDLEAISDVEKKIEISVAYKNGNNYFLYEKAKQLGKKIIITTDIHLPKDVIRQILSKNDINDVYKIYVSSEVKKSKNERSIFDYIISDLDINPRKIVHFGDNFSSDVINPMLKKWRVVFLERRSRETNDEIQEFFSNKVYSKDIFEEKGYETLGPLLYYYSKWIKEKIPDEEEILFLSRDGKIMKEAYDILYKENNSKYFYTSRRAVVVPSICLKSNFDEIMNSYSYGKQLSISKFLYYMGLDGVNVQNDEICDINKVEDKNKIFSYYKQYEKEITKNSQNQRKYFLKYIGSKKKINIVDIGWNGNMQKAIKTILGDNVEINGYYIGILNNEDNKHGFLFERKGENMHIEEEMFNALLEFVFSASHGSVSSYKEEKGEIIPVLLEYENDKNLDDILNKFQKGALDFVREFSEMNKFINICRTPQESGIYISKMFLKPTLQEAVSWGEIEFCDYYKKKIASPKKMWYYVVHPKIFLCDFKDSWWRPGFIKRLFRIDLPYSAIMKWYKRRKYNGK